MQESTFVILGATGDLTKRKLIPAIYRLIKDKKIKKIALVGVALPETTIKKVLSGAKRFIKEFDQKVWSELEKHSYYYSLDFHDRDQYVGLKELIEDVEKGNKLTGNRIFYMATMPDLFSDITEYLSKSDIVKKFKGIKGAVSKKNKWTRIVYEKPFGYDLKTFRSIYKDIANVFDESQIYRIDHYLGKELIGDIALIRFTNRIFEPLWNNKNIDFVQITLSEDICLEGRGEFYDKTGAISDMLQSHILQIMALVTMEPPKKLSGSYIREAKSKVLKNIKLDSAVLGQYEGYNSEKGVAKGSKTETFVAAKLSIKNRRWKGVPFYIRTGKCLDKVEHSIKIYFKHVDCKLDTCPSEPNRLTISFYGDEGFNLQVNSKVPGRYEVVPVKMDFCHSCLFGLNTPQAYENLLADVIRGDQSVFLRHDEIECSWKVVESLRKKQVKVHKYKKGTIGPKEIETLGNKAGWL